MTRKELMRLLEKAHAIEEARLTGSAGSGREPGVAFAGSGFGAAIPAMPARSGRVPLERPSRTWAGAPLRFRRVIHSDAALCREGLDRLVTLLEELGGARPVDCAVLAARETADGVRVEIRPESGGTRIEVTSDRRPEVVGATLGVLSLAAVGGVLFLDLVGDAGTAGLAAVCGGSVAGGYLALRHHLAAAAQRWQVRLDAVSASAVGLVRRASMTTSPHTGRG